MRRSGWVVVMGRNAMGDKEETREADEFPEALEATAEGAVTSEEDEALNHEPLEPSEAEPLTAESAARPMEPGEPEESEIAGENVEPDNEVTTAASLSRSEPVTAGPAPEPTGDVEADHGLVAADEAEDIAEVEAVPAASEETAELAPIEVEEGLEVEGEFVEIEPEAGGETVEEFPPVGQAAAAIARPRARREPPSEEGMPIQYAKRVTRTDRQEWGWWVDGDYFVESDGRGVMRRTHIGDILEVQTAPAPAKFRPWRHQTLLGLRNSRKIAIDNAHFVGVANYEDRSKTYAPFVRRLIATIAKKAPYAKARRGASYLGYVAMIGFVVVLIALVAVLLFLLPIEGVPGVPFIKVGLLALMTPPLVVWVAKSRPSGIPLSKLPPGALPRAKR